MRKLAITRFEPLEYATKEALNTLATNLSFAGHNVRKIMLTSCRPQEGKSFLSMNLMRTLADMGKHVVLVDADLRRSLPVAKFGIQAHERPIGLTHYLAGMCSVDDILFETDIMDAYMVLSGKEVANSLSLLTTSRFAELLNMLSNEFDYVIVDAPPVGTIIDAAEIAKSCDGVLFVVSENNIANKELTESVRQLEKTGCPILGAVLNKVSFDTRSSKRYYNKGYYANYDTENTALANKQGSVKVSGYRQNTRSAANGKKVP